MGKASFVVRRSLQLVVTLWAVGTVLFGLFRLMPGDPTSYVVSSQMTQEARQQIIASYGLNEPLHVQYIKFLENLVVLNFGQSFHSNQPVTDVIATYLPNTLVLMLTAFVAAYITGITLGVLSGWYRGSRFERSTVITALTARSVPTFYVGLIVLWIFGAGLGVIPMSGMTSLGTQNAGFWEMVFSVDFLHHLAAPAAVLAFYYMGYPLLIMRSSMLEVLSEDFIDVCRAKGLKERTIMFKHAARNALLPIVTAAAIALGYAVGGSVLIETVFAWPGIGREMVRAVLRRDFPVAQGTFIVLAGTIIVLNFLADLAYGYLDPRVTYD
ncbi:peptide/nickel transport system permease protein [Halogeometricum rufum]|jgi:peptide/nickel transport system permease protein|uniref:Peptide/nickel transport system permease protein n=1 Tax=Halogeometricum rufum TaxID=553469 RepID=A0A1I6J9F6_9EURY|nr:MULTISPECIES: ABC transporter permease [Halogeometricum]MUV58048.1 ABC transporter permease subunit [Halogeometricum sp. CBA1124]SFR75571.1 peptide/nickel transport system permease protein [Halogeometricum rufum]